VVVLPLEVLHVPLAFLVGGRLDHPFRMVEEFLLEDQMVGHQDHLCLTSCVVEERREDLLEDHQAFLCHRELQDKLLVLQILTLACHALVGASSCLELGHPPHVRDLPILGVLV